MINPVKKAFLRKNVGKISGLALCLGYNLQKLEKDEKK